MNKETKLSITACQEKRSKFEVNSEKLLTDRVNKHMERMISLNETKKKKN